MNRMEEEIIRNFVKESKQERILWELDSPRKRDKVIWKFAGSEILKKACLKPANYMSAEEMETYFRSVAEVGSVYFLGEDYIGDLPLREAIRRAQDGEICIFYCGNGVGYYQGEGDYKPPRYLLNKV